MRLKFINRLNPVHPAWGSDRVLDWADITWMSFLFSVHTQKHSSRSTLDVIYNQSIDVHTGRLESYHDGVSLKWTFIWARCVVVKCFGVFVVCLLWVSWISNICSFFHSNKHNRCTPLSAVIHTVMLCTEFCDLCAYQRKLTNTFSPPICFYKGKLIWWYSSTSYCNTWINIIQSATDFLKKLFVFKKCNTVLFSTVNNTRINNYNWVMHLFPWVTVMKPDFIFLVLWVWVLDRTSIWGDSFSRSPHLRH